MPHSLSSVYTPPPAVAAYFDLIDICSVFRLAIACVPPGASTLDLDRGLAAAYRAKAFLSAQVHLRKVATA